MNSGPPPGSNGLAQPLPTAGPLSRTPQNIRGMMWINELTNRTNKLSTRLDEASEAAKATNGGLQRSYNEAIRANQALSDGFIAVKAENQKLKDDHKTLLKLLEQLASQQDVIQGQSKEFRSNIEAIQEQDNHDHREHEFTKGNVESLDAQVKGLRDRVAAIETSETQSQLPGYNDLVERMRVIETQAQDPRYNALVERMHAIEERSAQVGASGHASNSAVRTYVDRSTGTNHNMAEVHNAASPVRCALRETMTFTLHRKGLYSTSDGNGSANSSLRQTERMNAIPPQQPTGVSRNMLPLDTILQQTNPIDDRTSSHRLPQRTEKARAQPSSHDANTSYENVQQEHHLERGRNANSLFVTVPRNDSPNVDELEGPPGRIAEENHIHSEGTVYHPASTPLEEADMSQDELSYEQANRINAATTMPQHHQGGRDTTSVAVPTSSRDLPTSDYAPSMSVNKTASPKRPARANAARKAPRTPKVTKATKATRATKAPIATKAPRATKAPKAPRVSAQAQSTSPGPAARTRAKQPKATNASGILNVSHVRRRKIVCGESRGVLDPAAGKAQGVSTMLPSETDFWWSSSRQPSQQESEGTKRKKYMEEIEDEAEDARAHGKRKR